MQPDDRSRPFSTSSVTISPAGNTNTPASTPYSRTSTLPGFTSSPPSHTRPTVHDPFDYEQKYAPDPIYEEWSPKARVWRVYGDEATQIDIEMVAGWREGLDMLLVFAALFSGVVTTFVTTTCKSLQLDLARVTNSLIAEMVSVQRATVHGAEAVDAVPPAVTSFPLQTSDFWVNALWFMSLGLSLSTTLLAVLAKQWIHQYLSVASTGSPRNRCRVRHFRYKALKKWHVPLIIELLPVLMHAALGLFFVGLVIYLCSLSTVMAAHMAIIATGAFGVYSVTNVLPVFYPDCAYKTPLSIHSFAAFMFIRQQYMNFFHSQCTPTSILSTSLPDIELEMVERQADVLDVSALACLFNTTPNLSVQSIILQAFSALPLPSVPFIGRSGPEGISVVQAINDHFQLDQPVDRFERFERAALRFEKQDPETELDTSCKESSYYAYCHDSDAAKDLVKKNLIGPPPYQTLDALLWGKIFAMSLSSGTQWLRIDHDQPSQLWSELLRCIVTLHMCERSNCDGNKQPLMILPLPGY
ncbi:hypothetical protein CPB85DRAFT_952340 [Mucidula mucida]|nr:hypothetical protein CPB85DRAFT_952340 [Mucidula mucida]